MYSFEPFPEAFNSLKEVAKGYSNVEAINNAVGNEPADVTFYVNKFSPTNSVLAPLPEASGIWENIMDGTAFDAKATIKVRSTTVDDFIEKKGIEQVDILKIDTQGSEYFVIEGAAEAIKKDKIRLVYLEILPLPTYKNQKHFDEILKLMRLCGFSLYNMYDFSYTKFGELRQLDALFLSSKIRKSIHP
jgi:FkbM family methyltransferase